MENIEEYRMMLSSSEEIEKITPQITSKTELKKLVNPTGLLIQYDFHDNVRRMGILFDCSWEVEHGLGVKIENEKVVEVGFQDVVL